jgi:hypothetical protein
MGFVLRTPGAAGPPPTRPEPPDYSDAPKCEHPRTDLRRMRRSDGVWVARPQCVTCGHGLQFVKKETIQGFGFLPVFDEELRRSWKAEVDQYWADRRAKFESAVQGHDAQWRAWYDTYLLSPKWQRLRDKVLSRDAFQCQGCRERRATQVHHLTYARVGNELLFDLISVCDQCHGACHGG